MNITRSVVAAMVVSVAVIASGWAQPQDKIPVFVRGAESADGFTDPSKDRQDSVKDILKKLKGSKVVQLVETEPDALAVIEVLGRDTTREVNGGTAVFGSAQNKSHLAVRLTAGEYAVEFVGESGSKGMMKGYGAAAGKVVDQLEAWVKANHDRLVALKK